MRHRLVVLALAALAGAGCARYRWVNELDLPGACPDARRPKGAFGHDALAVGAGWVAGRVAGSFGPDTVGAPLGGAQVIMRATGDTTRVSVAMTAEDGRFAFDTVPAGRYIILVRRVGYAQRQDTLDLPTERGVRLLVRLEAQGTDGPCSGFAMYRMPKPWWRFW